MLVRQPTKSAILAAMRPTLMQTLKVAVMSGDAPAARRLYREINGPQSTSGMSSKDALSHIDGWLSRQGETAASALEL